MSRTLDDMKRNLSSINEPQKRSSVKDTLAAGVPAQPTRQKPKQYSVSPAGLEAMIWDRSGNDETLRAAAYAEADRLYSTPGSGYYQPYRGVTNQSYLDDLQARGVDVSGGVNDTFFSQNAWYQQHLIPSDVTGTPGKPNAKAGTNEQWIAYDLYQLQKDEETTRKAESEWAQLQKEVAYWTRRGLTNEEIRGKIDMGKYKTLQGMDEAAARGTYTPLNRAVGYSQDAVDGVIWATRNGDDSGDYFRASVYAQQGKGRLDSGSTGLQIARRKPGSADWHPYYDGSTDDDARMLFDRDDFDMDWLNGTREEVLSSGDSDRIKAWQRVYAAESVTEQAEQEKADLDAWIAKRAEKVAEGKLERKTKKDGTLETWEEMAERLLFTEGSGAFDILDIKTLPKLDAGRANGKPVDLNRSVRYRREDAVAELAGVLRMAAEKKTAQQLLQDEIANLGAEENARQARIPAGSLKSSRRGPATQQDELMEGLRANAATALDDIVNGIRRIFVSVPEEGEPNPDNIPASALKDQTGRWIASQRMNQQRKLDEKEEAQRAEYEAGREKTASPEQAEADAMRRKEEYEAGLADGSIQNTRIQQIQEEHSTFFDTLDMLTDREGGKSGSAFIRSLPMRASTSYNDVMAAQGGSTLFSTYLAENGEISTWDDETLMDYLETAGYAYYDMGTADQDAKDHMMLVLAEAWRRKGMLTDEQLADPDYMAKWYQKASGALDEYWQMGADSNYLYFGASGEGDDSVSSMSDTQIEAHLRRVILNGGSKMVTAANDVENAAHGEPYISRTFGPQDEAVANEVYRVAPWLADASLYSDDIGGGVSWLGQDMVDMLQAIQSENASPEDVLDAWVIGYRAGKAAEDANLGTGISPAEWMQENPEYLRAAREITERVKAADEEVRLQTEAEQAQLKAAQVAALKRVMQATMEGNTESLRDSDVFTYKIATQVSDEEIHDLGESSPVYKEAKAAYRQMLRDRGEPTEGIAYEGWKAAGVYRIVAETLAKHQKLAEAMDMTVDELYEAWPELQMTPEQLAQTAENTYNAQFNEATLPEEQRQAVQILGISPEQQEPVGFWNTVGLAVGSGTMQFLSSYPGFVSDVIERDADVTAKTNQAYYTDKYGYSKAAGAFKRDILAHAATLGETDPRKAELLGYIRDSEATGRDIFSYPIDLNVEAVRRAQAPFERVMAANSDLVERRGTDLEKRTYRVVSSATNSGLGSGASMLATAATGGSALIGTALGFFPMSFDNAYKSAIAKGYTPGDAKAYATAQAAAETLTEQAVINSTLNPSDRFIDWLGNATMDRIATSGLKSKILYNAAHFTASYVRSVAEETAQEYFQSAVSGAIDVVSAAMRGEKINLPESFSEFSADQMLDTFLSVALSVSPNAAATYVASSQAAVDRTLSRLWNAMSAEDRAAYDNSFTRFKENPLEVSHTASAVAGAARRALEAAAAAPAEQAAETAAPAAETAQTETEAAPAAEAQEAPAEAGEQAVTTADAQEAAQTAEGTAAEAAPAPTGVHGAQTVTENGPVEQARRNVEVLTQQQSEVQTQLEEAEGRVEEAQKELKKRKDKKRNIKRRKSGNNATTDIDDEIAIWETEVKNRKAIAENLRKRLSTVTEQLGKAQETAREAGRAQNGTQAVNEATDATAPAQEAEQTAPETVSEEQTAPAAVEETAAEEQTAPAEAQEQTEQAAEETAPVQESPETRKAREMLEKRQSELARLEEQLESAKAELADMPDPANLKTGQRINLNQAAAQADARGQLESSISTLEGQVEEWRGRVRDAEAALQEQQRNDRRVQDETVAAPEATERTEAQAETASETVQEAPAAPVSEQTTENTSAPVETQEAPAQAETEAAAQETTEEPKTGTERLEENARLLSEAGAQVATATGNLLTFPASSRPIDLVDSWSRSATNAIITGTRMSLLTRTEQDALNNRLESVRKEYRSAFAMPQETEEQKAAKTKALEDATRDMLQVASSLGDLVNLARDMHMTAANEEMQAGFAERKGEIMRAMMGEILNRPDTMTYMVNQMAATFTAETIATTMQNGLPTDVSFFGQELVARAQEIAQKKLEAQKKLNAAEADLNKAKAAMMRNNTARLNARQKGDSKAETRCINKSAQLEADVAKARKAVAAAEDEMTAVITEQDAVEEQVMEVIRQDSMARAQAAMQQEAERFNEEEAERQETAREEAQAEAAQPAEETQAETQDETEEQPTETNAVSQLVDTARTPAQRAEAVELATAPDDLDTIIYDTERGYTKQQKRKAKDKRLAAMSSEEDFYSVVTDDTGAWSKTDKQKAAEGLMDIWRQDWTEERATRVLDAASGIFSSAALTEARDWYNEHYRQAEAEEETAPEAPAVEETAQEAPEAPVAETAPETAEAVVENAWEIIGDANRAFQDATDALEPWEGQTRPLEQVRYQLGKAMTPEIEAILQQLKTGPNDSVNVTEAIREIQKHYQQTIEEAQERLPEAERGTSLDETRFVQPETETAAEEQAAPMTPEEAADRVLEAREQEDIAEQEATMDDGTEEAARRQEEAQEALADEAAVQAEEETAPEAPENAPETAPEAAPETVPEAPVEQETAPEAPAAETQQETAPVQENAEVEETAQESAPKSHEVEVAEQALADIYAEEDRLKKRLRELQEQHREQEEKAKSIEDEVTNHAHDREELDRLLNKAQEAHRKADSIRDSIMAVSNALNGMWYRINSAKENLEAAKYRAEKLQLFDSVIAGTQHEEGIFTDNDRTTIYQMGTDAYQQVKQAILSGKGYIGVWARGRRLFLPSRPDGSIRMPGEEGWAYDDPLKKSSKPAKETKSGPVYATHKVTKPAATIGRIATLFGAGVDSPVHINLDAVPEDLQRTYVKELAKTRGFQIINDGVTDLNRLLRETIEEENDPARVAAREKAGMVMQRIRDFTTALSSVKDEGEAGGEDYRGVITKLPKKTETALSQWLFDAYLNGGSNAEFADMLLNVPEHMLYGTVAMLAGLNTDNFSDDMIYRLVGRSKELFGEENQKRYLAALNEKDKLWQKYTASTSQQEEAETEQPAKKPKEKSSKKKKSAPATDAYIPATETRQLDLLTGLTEGDRQNEQQPAPQTAEIAARTPPAQTEQAKKGKSKVQSPQTIFRQLAKDLHLGNDIRGRSFDVAKAMGYYQRQGDFVNIRAGHSQDFWTTMHEIGHAIHSRLGNYQPSQHVIDHFKATPMAESYKPEQYAREAQAELNRLYMMNRDFAVDVYGADEIARYEKALEDAGMMGYVTQARLALAEFIAADTDTRARAMIVTGPQEVRPSSFRQRLADMTRRFIASQVDDTYAAARVDHLARQGDAQGAISLQQSITMQKFSARTADALLTQALSDASGQRVRESFHDAIFKSVPKAAQTQEFMDDVMLYWLYKHALDRHEQMGQHAPIDLDNGNSIFDRDGTVFGQNLTMDDIRRRVAEYEATQPAVVSAQVRAANWWGDFMKTWMVDTGLISRQQYDDLRQKWPNYIPTMRDVGAAGSNVRGGNESFKFKSIKGSDLNILNPFATMPKIVLDTVTQARRNQSAGVLYDMMRARNGQVMGIGEFGHIVSPDRILQSIHGTTVEDTLNKALARLGLTTDDISIEAWNGRQLTEREVAYAEAGERAAKMLQGMSDEEVAEFLARSPKVTNLTELLTAIGKFSEWHRQSFSSMPNVITYQENGKNHLIYVEDVDLFHALTDGKNVQKSQQVLTAVSVLTRTMSRLTTGSNPLFAVKNLARDFQQSVNHGSWAVTYADGIVKWARAAYELVRKTDTAQQYLALGGGGFTYIQGVNSEENGLQNIRKLYSDYNREGLPGTAVRGFRRVANWLTLDRLNELIEQTSRYAEYRFGKHDLSTAEGRQKAFLAAQEATVNFSLKGYGKTPAFFRAIIPFYNATLQGTWQSVKTLSEAERDRLPARIAKTLTNNMILGALSYALCRLLFRDDDDREAYDMLSDEIKMSNIIFPNFGGKDAERRFIRIPLTQNVWGKAFYAAGQRLMAEAGQDALTYDLANVVDSILRGAIPTDTIVNPIIDVMLNRTWYGGTLDPSRFTDNDTPSTQRFTDSTLGLFRRGSALLAQAGINISPIALQYLAQQYSGFIGQVAIPAFSEGQYREGFTPLRNLLDVFRNSWTIDPAYTNDVSNAFFSARDMLSKSIAKTIQDHGRSDALRETLTEDELRDAYQEAVALTSKGGVFYEANEEIKRLYKLMDAVSEDSSLDEHTKRVTARDYRMQIARVQEKALEAYDAYQVKYMYGRTMINRILGIDQPTISVKLPDIQTMDRDEPYMQALYAARDGGEKIKMPQPSTSITVNKRTYNVTRMPQEAQEAYTEAYREAYRDYVENADELTAAITEKAHSKAHAAAKAALMEWVSDNDWNTDNEEGE